MVEALLEKPIELFREGDIDGALADIDEKLKSHADVPELHHMWAEFANMKNMEAQDDVVPGRKIMNAYKKAMELDEDNMEYIADFASFALECRRIPVAVKEFQRYARRLESLRTFLWTRCCLPQAETSLTPLRSWIQAAKHP